MDLETFVQAQIDASISFISKPQIQKVMALHLPSYTLYTKEMEGSAIAATLDNVKVVTPYAGNGFGMVCSPRANENIVALPLRSKANSAVAVGRIFIDDDEVPKHSPGDFLIHHETHSKLLFSISQPPMTSDGIRNGDILTPKTNLNLTTKSSRTFGVKLEETGDTKLPPLRERELVYVYYGNFVKSKGGDEAGATATSQEKGGSLFAWKSHINLSEDEASISISSDMMEFPGTIPDYTDIANFPDDNFKIVRVSPMKGYTMLSHYTGSSLEFEELPDFKTLFPDYETIFTDNDVPKVVRYNQNAVLGPFTEVETKDDEPKTVVVSHHRPKGSLLLRHYSKSGLKISEQEPQNRGHKLKLDINLTPEKVGDTEIFGEVFSQPLPIAQMIMEDITQGDIDVGTRIALRHLSSAVIDERVCETDYTPSPIPQKETGHFGIDAQNKEEIALEGSGIFMRDFLRRYNPEKKGWEFVSLSEANEYYQENLEKYYEKFDGYDIEETERIVPASGRRDVLLRKEDIKDEKENEDPDAPTIYDVKLIGYNKTVDAKGKIQEIGKTKRTDKNKELIGQKGYTYKTQGEKSDIKEKTFEDGYLCFPKGDIGLRHYTRSGIEIKELEPNLDYHALQAAFSLFAWDNGQYYQPHHTTDKDRNFRNMKFGPYPLPLGQLVFENAKYQKDTSGLPSKVKEKKETSPEDGQLLQDTLDGAAEDISSALTDAIDSVGDTIKAGAPALLESVLGGLKNSLGSIPSANFSTEASTDAETISPTDLLLNNALSSNPLLGELWIQLLLGQKAHLSTSGQAIFNQIFGDIEKHHLSADTSALLKKEANKKWANQNNDIIRSAKQIQVLWNKNQINNDYPVVEDKKGSIEEATALADIRRIVELQKIIGDNFLSSLKIVKNYTAPVDDYAAPFETFANSSNTNSTSTTNEGEAEGLSSPMMFPTPLLGHTIHPQPDMWEDEADKERTTLALPGETATSLSLYQYSSHIQTVGEQVKLDEERIGTRFLIRDYVMRSKPEDESSHLIAASKWENERGVKHNLIAPKGSMELHHYTTSGLTIADKRPHFLNKVGGGHAMCMKLEMRSLDFLQGAEKENEDPSAGKKQGEAAKDFASLSKKMGGDVLTKSLEGGETETAKPTPLFANPDGTFFCEILSNELVDKKDEYPVKVDKDGRLVTEEDSNRGKVPEDPHGKRGGAIGITHDTTRSENHDIPGHLWFEDYIVELEDEEGDEIDQVLQPTHLYKEAEKGKTRELIMPRGYAAFELYNRSSIMFGDAVTDIETPPAELDELERGKYQLPFTSLSMRAWNNMEIEDAESTPAEPFEDVSAELSFTCIADQANTEGKDATRVFLIQKSSQQKDGEDDGQFGSSLLFQDFTKDEGEHKLPCHGYKEADGDKERLELTFPKGRMWLQSYNGSGLFVEDKIKEELEEQQVSLKLAMREWNNAEPEESGNKFDVDSTYLLMEELAPKETKKGKRASIVKLEALTSKSEAADSGNCLIFEDYVEDEKPAHIFEEDDGDGEALQPSFPKGVVKFQHYTESGLYIDEQELGEEDHQPVVNLTLRRWKEDKPDTKDVARFFAETTTTLLEEESNKIGFLHVQSESSFSAEDSNPDPEKNKMVCSVIHQGKEKGDIGPSCLKIEDMTEDGKAEIVKAGLYHLKGSLLRLEQLNKKGDTEIDFHHFKKAGFKVINSDDDVTITIYHPKGSKIVFDKDGNITATSVKDITANAAENITATAGKKATVNAPDIYLNGNVHVDGNLDVMGKVSASETKSDGQGPHPGHWF